MKKNRGFNLKKNKHEVGSLSLWKLSWPLFFQLLLVYGVLLTDSYFLSRLSDYHAGAVGAVFPAFCVCYMIFNQLGQAGCSVASQYMGAKKFESVTPTYIAAVFVLLICGVSLSAAMFYFSDNIASLVGLANQEKDVAILYTKVVGSALFLEALKGAYNGILSSRAKTMWSLGIGVVYILFNLVANIAFFVFLPELGVIGVGISTVLAQIMSFVLCLYAVHWKEKIAFNFKSTDQSLFAIARKILWIGIPASLEPISVQFMSIIVTQMIVGFGMDAMTAKTYAFNLVSLVIAWSVSIGVGTLILVAHSVGARDFENANRQMHRSMFINSVVSTFVVAFLWFFSDQIFSNFTTNASILNIAKALLAVSIFCEPLRAMNIVMAYALSSAGDSRFNAVAGPVIMWVIGLPLCYFIGVKLGFGVLGIWVGLSLDELLRGIVYYSRWRMRKWETTGVVTRETLLEVESLRI